MDWFLPPQQGHHFQPAEPSRLRGAARQPHPLLPQPLGGHQREGVAIVRVEVIGPNTDLPTEGGPDPDTAFEKGQNPDSNSSHSICNNPSKRFVKRACKDV